MKGGILIRNKKNKFLLNIKNISKEDAIKDYEKLKNADCDKNINSVIGNKFLDYYFFEQRVKTTSKKNINFLEFLIKVKKNDISPKEKILLDKFLKWVFKNEFRNIYVSLYKFFQLYYGSISQFRPMTAKYIYCKYNPKSILDFSCGWGGRLLAAISLNIPYIGFDTNINLKESYKDILKLLKPKKTKIIFKDSSKVDYSKYDYDMVFTSPPYGLIEKYENMPEYLNKKDFNENFLFPVVINTYKHLKKGGKYILNIPIKIYDDLKDILGEANEKLPLSINKRTTSNYKEYIYVWYK